MRKGKEYEFLIEETEFPGTGIAKKGWSTSLYKRNIARTKGFSKNN